MNSNTLAIAIGVISVAVAILSLLFAYYRRQKALVISACGFLANAIGYCLLPLQSGGSPWLGFVLSNILIVGFHSALAWSMRERLGIRRPWPFRFWIYLAVWMCWQLVFVVVLPNYLMRAVAASFMFGLFALEFLAALSNGAVDRIRPVRKALVVVAAAYLIGQVVRIFMLTATTTSETVLLDNNLVTTYSILVLLVFIILWGGILPVFDSAMLFAQLEEVNHGLEIQAQTDHLTKLANRHVFDADVSMEISRCQSYQDVSSLIVFDLDDFKQVNDTGGHDAGDRLLTRVTDAVKQGLRLSDRLYRWGGDEFFVLCRHTPLEGAAALAEKLRSSIETLSVPEMGPITASFGVAELGDSEGAEFWLKRADQALYEAKQAGRNNVRTAAKALADTEHGLPHQS